MKTIDKFAILCILAAAVAACGQKPDPEPIPDDPTETRTLTFVLPSFTAGEGEELPAGIKTAWAAGDQIVVHGEYAKDQVTVTLAASDISADGKSATQTVSGLYPYKRDDCTSTLYAAYPASAVDNLKHCFFYSAFKPVNMPLMAACNTGETFNFVNLTSAVSFVVDGDFDSFSFTARKDINIGFSRYQVKITDKEVNLKQYLEGATSTILSTELVADGETVNTLFVPGGLPLDAGFILTFSKDGKSQKLLKDKEEVIVEVGELLDLGDVTDFLVDAADDIDPDLATSIDLQGNANCYIVYEPGVYKFKAVKGNTDKAITGIDAVELLWETYCDTEEVTPRTVVEGCAYDEDSGSVCFKLPTPVKPGNALLAALDKDENVLWSWHIWIPETPITDDTHGFGSFKMMSRNLGALVDTEAGAPADPRSFGLLYQWGRKDPFLGASAIDSTEPVTFAGTAMTVAEGPVDPETVFDKPTVFFNVSGAWATGNDNMMWGDVERDASAEKSVYDPCPAGYRIPGRKHFSIFQNNGSTIAGWNFDAANGVVQLGSPLAYFPVCGYLQVDGTLANGSAIVWDARNDYESTKTSYSMYINNNESVKQAVTRAFGGSVRCEAE